MNEGDGFPIDSIIWCDPITLKLEYITLHIKLQFVKRQKIKVDKYPYLSDFNPTPFNEELVSSKRAAKPISHLTIYQ